MLNHNNLLVKFLFNIPINFSYYEAFPSSSLCIIPKFEELFLGIILSIAVIVLVCIPWIADLSAVDHFWHNKGFKAILGNMTLTYP